MKKNALYKQIQLYQLGYRKFEKLQMLKHSKNLKIDASKIEHLKCGNREIKKYTVWTADNLIWQLKIWESKISKNLKI